MSAGYRTNQKPIGAVVAIVVVAAAAWGVYAWKFADTPEGAVDSPSARAPIAQPGADDAGEAVVSADSPLLNMGSTVRANAPASIGDEATEMTLAPKPADSTAAASPSAHGDMSPSPAEFGTNAARALKTGREALGSSELVKARAALSRALQLGVSASDEEFIRRELERISDVMVFSRAAAPGDPLVEMHTVRSGENLLTIANKYKISDRFIMTLNGHKDPDMIWAGTKLKVVKGPFSAKIYKSAHRMDVFLGDVFVRSFPVGLGTDGGTPTGEWTIKSKLANPDWSDPATGRYYAANDPENPIGEHWISLDCVSGECMGRMGFGIHGTIDPKSIGADMSMGCVRLTPDDVAMVFDLLVPKHSRVTILP